MIIHLCIYLSTCLSIYLFIIVIDSSSDSSDDSDNYQIPPDATPGYIEPHDNSVEIGRDRSYTTNLPCESGGKVRQTVIILV